MKGRNPSKEEKEYMDKVQQLGCIVCANRGFPDVPAEIHHTRGKTVEDAHLYVLPLCPSHHRYGGHIEPISRHPYKKRFEDAYGTEAELLKQVQENLAGSKNIYQSQVLTGLRKLLLATQVSTSISSFFLIPTLAINLF